MKKGKHSRKRRILWRSAKARQTYFDALLVTIAMELWYLFVAFLAGAESVTVALVMLASFVPVWLISTVVVAMDYTGREIAKERMDAMRWNARR